MISRCVPRSHSASYIIGSIIGQMTWTSTLFFCVWEWGESLWVTVPTAAPASNPQRAHGPSGQGTNSTGLHICLSRYTCPDLHPTTTGAGASPHVDSSAWQARNVAPCRLSLKWSLRSPGGCWAPASFHPSLFLILSVRILSCGPVFSPRWQCR